MARQKDSNFAFSTPYIMLVDDNHMELELNSLTLEEVDPRIKTQFFSSAGEVLEYLRKESPLDHKPAFMLLDLKMPVMDGLELLDVLQKEQLKTFPIIVLSSSVLNEDQIRAKQLGADDYRTKPISYPGNFELFKSLLDKFLPATQLRHNISLPNYSTNKVPKAMGN